MCHSYSDYTYGTLLAMCVCLVDRRKEKCDE